MPPRAQAGRAKLAAKPTAKPAAKPAAKPVAKPAAKLVAKPVAKPAAKPVAKAAGFFTAPPPAAPPGLRRGVRRAALLAEAREGVPARPVDVGEPADAGLPVPAPPGGPPPAAHTAHEWTAAEATERLAGMDEIARDDWERIPYGVRVRYFLRGGPPGGEFPGERFQPGGYIAANPLDIAPADGAPPRRYFRFQTGFDQAAGRRTVWVVPYDDIARVFVRLNAGTLFSLRALATVARAINENYARVEAVLSRLDARITRLEQATGGGLGASQAMQPTDAAPSRHSSEHNSGRERNRDRDRR